MTQFDQSGQAVNTQYNADKIEVNILSEGARKEADYVPQTCPRCNLTDKVEKASAVYAKQSSNLAQRLAPPLALKPKLANRNTRFFQAARIFYILAVIGLPIYVLGDMMYFPHLENLPGYILAGIFWAGSFYSILAMNLQIAKEEKRYQESLESMKIEMPKWERAMKRWDDLYYCTRDDCVFLSNERTSTSLQSIIEYIYRE